MAKQPRRPKPPAPRQTPVPRILDERGQMWLPLGGEEYCVRPDYHAIAAIEAKLGPLTDLAASAGQDRLTVAEMAVIVAEMMRAYSRANPDQPSVSTYAGADPERLAELIYDAGVPRICARLLPVLMGAVTGGYDASGELKPAAEEKGKASESPPPDAG